MPKDRISAIEPADQFYDPEREGAVDGARKSHHDRIGVTDEATGEDYPMHVEAARRALIEERPGEDRTKRFGEQPTLADVVCGKLLENCAGVVVDRPCQGAWVGEFDEVDVVSDGRAEAADERPITVHTGQINESWMSGFAMNANLQILSLIHVDIQ